MNCLRAFRRNVARHMAARDLGFRNEIRSDLGQFVSCTRKLWNYRRGYDAHIPIVYGGFPPRNLAQYRRNRPVRPALAGALGAAA
jgi:hypothetical protein